MTKPAIVVNNLGKQYKRGLERARYKTFREAIMNLVKAPYRRFKSLTGASSRDELFWALKDVSFEIQPGEVVGLIGRNGAGKSTLLKILSRITSPTTGTVRLRGRVGCLLEVGTGFHPELTGRENIYLNGAILGMKKAEIDRKFDEIVAFAEVEKFLDTPVKHYSSGMYVRLGFAVAANLEPDVLLIDEVLAVGDSAFQKKCLGKLGEVAGQGRTVIFVSHNMSAIRKFCPRVLLIEGGVLSADGHPDTIVNRYLGETQNGVFARDWPDSSEAPHNGSIRIRRIVAFGPDGRPLNYVDTDTPFRVEITYDLVKGDASAGFTVIVTDSDGHIMFCSVSNQEPNWYGKVMPAGSYTTACDIPGGFLNNVWVNIGVNFFGRGYSDPISLRDVLCFEVADGLGVRGDYHGGYAGSLRPRLQWRTERIRGGCATCQ